MREQGDGADPPRRQFERSRERHARRILEPNLSRHPRLHYRWRPAYSMQVTVRRPDMAEKQRFGQWRVG
jgi:hypothetical protein